MVVPADMPLVAAGALPTSVCDRDSSEGGFERTSVTGTDCVPSVDWFEQADAIRTRAIAVIRPVRPADLIMFLVHYGMGSRRNAGAG